MPFIDELLSSINTIICDLQPQQVQTFYEAVGHMISASTDQSQQEQLIEKYMQLPNQVTCHVNKQQCLKLCFLFTGLGRYHQPGQ